MFASSANPSGKGNRGLVEGIGEQIANEADLIIESNDYVASIQPDKTIETRYEQGVMVSFVDSAGKLIPHQGSQRSITPAPVLIRKGLAVDKIQLFCPITSIPGTIATANTTAIHRLGHQSKHSTNLSYDSSTVAETLDRTAYS